MFFMCGGENLNNLVLKGSFRGFLLGLKMKIAIEGCAHGELENIYNTIEYIEKQNNITVDLLLCCGDFQATRNLDDLNCMAVPPKFRSLCTFYKYFSGEKLAPKLTIFIGGNHEASNYLQELPYGGWVAPNIYYLGYAGVVDVGGIRIGGLSGIFKGYDFARGRFEKPPYDRDTIRSCYHFRNLDVFRLKQLSPPVHIMLSHDWPAGIANYGDIKKLLRAKPFFKEEIESNTLGNEPAFELLQHMKPDYWFAAHLHVKFAALVEHKDESESKKTRFLSLDKCLPKRKFLQIIDIPQECENGINLKYDLEWLTILHLTNHLLSVKKLNNYMPGPNGTERWMFTPSKEEMDSVMKMFQHDLNIPKNFVPTAPAYNPSGRSDVDGVECKQNPQTVEFCEKLGIDDPISLLLNESGLNVTGPGSNMSSLEFSSFIEPTKPEIEVSSPRINSVRTPLKLPTPKVELHDVEENILTSTPIEKSQVLDSDSTQNSFNLKLNPEESESNFEKGKEASSGPWPKKFKRRNMALYASNDDD